MTSLQNSVLGENLENAACHHDPAELECRRSARRSGKRCSWETTRSALPPTVPPSAAQDQGTSRNDIYENLGHFDNLNGHRALRNPQCIHHAVHQLRHRKIKNLHQRCKLAKILHDVPLHLALPASDLRQRCWLVPAGLFFETEELRLGCGGLPDLRRVLLLVLPTPRPWPSSVTLRNGAKTRPGPWRRSSAHAATWSGAVALFVAERRHSTVGARQDQP